MVQHPAADPCSRYTAIVAGMVLSVLAHQGGWDEAALVALPMALFAGLLMLANRRATKVQAERQREQSERD